MWQAGRDVIVGARRIFLVLAACLVLAGGLTPVLNGGTASAAAVTQRSVKIGSGISSASTTFTFTFTPAQTTQIQSMKFQACTTALGTCTPGGTGVPAGINLSGGAITQGGTWGGATAFTKDTATGGCTNVDTLCVKRTDATVQTLVAHSIIDTGATNQNSTNCSGAANCTFFIRMTTFSDNAYTTTNDTGTMASATTQTLTVNATIQETLTFCIGSTTIDDATTAPAACASISGTSLNLGNLDSSHINVSPVASSGDSKNGIAELSTNASNGATVVYDAIQQSGTNHKGTLRVAGATCSASAGITNDQCINAIGTTKAQIVTGAEAYGMTVAGVNCAATTAYSCTFAGGTYNLVRDANYNCQGSNTYISTEHDQITGTSGCSYAWDESGTADTVAASVSPNGPVDREALILKFAATPNIVTPAGPYTTQADFVATPTY